MDSTPELPKITLIGGGVLYTYDNDDDADTTVRPTCIPPDELARMKAECGLGPEDTPPPPPSDPSAPPTESDSGGPAATP